MRIVHEFSRGFGNRKNETATIQIYYVITHGYLENFKAKKGLTIFLGYFFFFFFRK